MPPTSTPLSGCPLKRLEVHDRLADKFFEAAHLDAALTLSLEGQRSPSEDRGDLVLQAHCGLQRVLSIALTDLLNSPNGKADSVSVEKDLWQLCVHSQQHDQRVLASFAEARDFNVAACMLRKFGFQVKTGIAQPKPSPGPRLSSITPLPWPGSPDQAPSGPDPSFASMLNSSVPIAQGQGAVYGQYQPLTSPLQLQAQAQAQAQAQGLSLPGSPLSPQHFVPQMPPAVYHSPFNPYHVFLGRQVHSHQPMVGSPLRNSFPVEGTPEPVAMAGLDPLLHPNPSRLGMLQDGRSISVPIMPYVFHGSQESQFSGSQESQTSQYSLDPHYLYPQAVMSPLHLTPPSGAEVFSQSSMGSPHSSQPPVRQDIKDLMPPPRELPFAQKKKSASKKTVTPKPKPRPKTTPETKALPKAKAKNETSKARSQAKAKSQAKIQAKPKAKSEAKPKAQSEAKPKAGSQAKSKAKSRAKTAAKDEPQVRPRPQRRIEPAKKGKSTASPRTEPEAKQNGPLISGETQRAETVAEQPPLRASMAKPEENKGEAKVTAVTESEILTESDPSANEMQLRSGTRKRDAPSPQDPNPDRRKKYTKPTPIQPQHAPKISPIPSISSMPVSSLARTSTISSQSTCHDTNPPLPTMLLTDRDVLEKINRATAKLLGQYEADLARGCGAEVYARFYAERIHLVRRDFWVAELGKAEGGNYCLP